MRGASEAGDEEYSTYSAGASERATKQTLAAAFPRTLLGATETLRALSWLADPLLMCIESEADAGVRDAWLGVFGRWRSTGEAPLAERMRALAERAIVQAEGVDAPVRGALTLLATFPARATDKTLGLALARQRAEAPETRAALAQALAMSSDKEVQALLAELAQDPAPLVRIAVLRVVAERRLTASADLVADLLDLTRDPLPAVAVAAVRALMAQNRPELTARLATDPTPHIRRALRAGSTPP